MLAEHQDHLRQLQRPRCSRAHRRRPALAPAAACRPVTEGPAAPRQAISYLGAAEQAASDRLIGQVAEVPPSLAQLFASIAASEATHVPDAGGQAEVTRASGPIGARAGRSGRTAAEPADVGALQAALAAEQAAAYGYGVVGSHLSGRSRKRPPTDWVAHQAAADKLDGLLTAGGATPARPGWPTSCRPGPHPAQPSPWPPRSRTRSPARTWTWSRAGHRDLRMLGAQQARAAALRAARWRGTAEAFPGLPGHSHAHQCQLALPQLLAASTCLIRDARPQGPQPLRSARAA